MQSLLQQLERLVGNAMRMPVGGKLLIDEGAMRRLVDEMRAALPDGQHEAQRLAGERERILADARTQARRIVEDAHEQAGTRLDDQTVVVAHGSEHATSLPSRRKLRPSCGPTRISTSLTSST